MGVRTIEALYGAVNDASISAPQTCLSKLQYRIAVHGAQVAERGHGFHADRYRRQPGALRGTDPAPVPDQPECEAVQEFDSLGTYAPIFAVAGGSYFRALFCIQLLSPRLEPAKLKK